MKIEDRDEVIKNGGGYSNFRFASEFGLPELHRQVVIDRGDGIENYMFAIFFKKPELHRQVIISRGDDMDNCLFAKRFGMPELHRKVVIDCDNKRDKLKVNKKFRGAKMKRCNLCKQLIKTVNEGLCSNCQNEKPGKSIKSWLSDINVNQRQAAKIFNLNTAQQLNNMIRAGDRIAETNDGHYVMINNSTKFIKVDQNEN